MEAIEFIVGITFLFLGISFILRQQDWIKLIEHIEGKGNRAVLVMGMLNTLAGSAILGFHFTWAGMSLIVTIIGVIFLVRGFLCLMYPSWVLKKLHRLMNHSRNNLKIASVLVILTSALVLHNWWLIQYGWMYGYQPSMEFNDVFETSE